MVRQADEPGIHCSTLHDACLNVLASQPCSRGCKQRTFEVDVYGSGAAKEVDLLLWERRKLRDPLESFKLRHLEKGWFRTHNTSTSNSSDPKRESIHLLWPHWENGYSDLVQTL